MRCLMHRVSYEASDNSIPFFTVFCKKVILQIYYKFITNYKSSQLFVTIYRLLLVGGISITPQSHYITLIILM